MPVVHTADTVTHETHGARFTAYANPSVGSAEVCVWQVHVPAGSTGVPHTLNREEIFVVTSGALRFTLDDDTATLRPGEAVVVPAGHTLRVDNHGDTPATAMVSTTVGIEGTLADGTTFTPPWAR